MKHYIHYFNNIESFSEMYNGEEYIEPWLSLITVENENVIKFNKKTYHFGYLDIIGYIEYIQAPPGSVPVPAGLRYRYATDWKMTSASNNPNPRTFFSWQELGIIFGTNNESAQDGTTITNDYCWNSQSSIVNFMQRDNYILPSTNDFKMLFGKRIRLLLGGQYYKRNGAIVNGLSNFCYSLIELSDVTTATLLQNSPYYESNWNNYHISGAILFPDNEIIQGVNLYKNDDSLENLTSINESQLNEYLEQGCFFLPMLGYKSDVWEGCGEIGRYLTTKRYEDFLIGPGYIGEDDEPFNDDDKEYYDTYFNVMAICVRKNE